MSEMNDDPWAETPVIDREGYQLRGNDDPREEWRMVLLVTAILIALSAIAAESFGGTRLEADPADTEIQSR
ncbi:hypothetical protein [uncultured Salinicola sp.]|uniref:hypothetical protein n=1 Tax=uncultured Salinicola sp. TaxID=1193542 RepID=UPI002639E2B8|nr:hypothetical protein [uncultured Salinicola sp.]